jgi:uncharacterized membrane protein
VSSEGSDDRHRTGTPAGSGWDAEDETEARATDRVITFSDAVVAIAITLLAIDLPIPASKSNGQFLYDLSHANRSAYLAFLISFLVIANHWSTHRKQFRYVCKLDSRLTRLNMLWLLMIILVPFSTRVVTSDGQLGARFMVYAVNQIIATGCALAMSREVRAAHLLRPTAPASARHADPVPYLSMMLLYAVSIPVAFVAGSWAFALWALSPRVGNLLRRWQVTDRFVVDDTGG